MESDDWAELAADVAETLTEGMGWRVWLCIGVAMLIVTVVVVLS